VQQVSTTLSPVKCGLQIYGSSDRTTGKILFELQLGFYPNQHLRFNHLYDQKTRKSAVRILPVPTVIIISTRVRLVVVGYTSGFAGREGL